MPCESYRQEKRVLGIVTTWVKRLVQMEGTKYIIKVHAVTIFLVSLNWTKVYRVHFFCYCMVENKCEQNLF